MSIKSTSRSIESLFGTKYYIDFYQRDYKWEQGHIETLLDDVYFRFETDYIPDVDPTTESVSKYTWYYLSTYVTNEQDGRRFIVDGQQRLTTITLILIKLYHLAKAHDHEHHTDWLKQNIYGTHAEGRTFWMGTGSREKALEKLFKDGSPDSDLETQNLTVRNIYNNYQIIDEYLDQRLLTARQVKAFTLYFMKRVELVELDIDDSRDVAMVFEVINDRGEKLQPYEVLKGELLGQLTKEEVNNTYYDIWVNSINPLQDRDKREPDRFFRLFFRSKHTNNRDEYREFEGEYQRQVFAKKWDPRLELKRNPDGVKRFLREDVAWYSQLYCDLLNRSEKQGDYVYFNVYLNRHDRQHLLIMSAIDSRDPDRDKKIDLVARLFDRNFTLLQLTGSYNTNRFTESIIALNTAIRNASCEAIQETFDRQLLEGIFRMKNLTVTDPFQWSLFRNVGYELGSRFLRYFLARMEHFIGSEARLPIDNYHNLVRNRGATYGYHVEHILADNAENRALFRDEEQFVRERNRLGGLLLLKGRDNQSSGNEPYREKLKTYSHSTRLSETLTADFYHSNLDFADLMKRYNLDFRPIATFDRDALEERQMLYFELAKLIWGDCSFPIA